MKPQDAINERHRNSETPQICYACRHSYNDVQEGWNCTKFDAVIELSSGATINWYGQACDRAYAGACKGRGFARAAIPVFFRKHPLMTISILTATALFGVFIVFLFE